MPRQVPNVGDAFLVPLDDATGCLGQIVEIEREVLNSVTAAFFGLRLPSPPSETELADLVASAPIACLFVTRDLFNAGLWARVGRAPVRLEDSLLPHRDARRRAWVGARVIGSGIVEKFLNAYFGLREWDEMNDPKYYSKLLLPGVVGPARRT